MLKIGAREVLEADIGPAEVGGGRKSHYMAAKAPEGGQQASQIPLPKPRNGARRPATDDNKQNVNVNVNVCRHRVENVGGRPKPNVNKLPARRRRWQRGEGVLDLHEQTARSM